jgi:hypothetical protein
MKRIGLLFLCLLLTMAIFSFKAKDDNPQENTSAIILKLRYKSPGLSGYGGTLRLRNTETNTIYESRSKVGINPFVVITNIPKGTYIIEEIQVITGYNTLTIRDQSFFQPIHIDAPEIYYLGNYKTKKVAPLSGMHFQVRKEDNDDEKKIYKQLGKEADSWLKYKITFDHSLFRSDSTTNIDWETRR